MAGTVSEHLKFSGKRRLSRGSILGKYRLVKLLGEGGYGEVWKAHDRIEGIQVALKIPIRDGNGAVDNQTLLREVSLIAKLRHPNIMPLKNADIIEGRAILATELSYKTLDDCSKPMAPGRLISILTQVLDGLAHAHRNRVVHCDVTPGNIFLFPNGRAALGDFGISRTYSGKMATVDEFGTPGYVAPEQAYGHPTYRSDCFAVALILYEYLTGYLPRWPFSWPFRGLKRVRDKAGPGMVKFLKEALSVHPDQRFANAGIMRLSLNEAMPKFLQRKLLPASHHEKKVDWLKARRDAFISRYGKLFPKLFECRDCGEPIGEFMSACPWCGSERNRFDAATGFDYVCSRCHKGMLGEWPYCPWCYGGGYEPSKGKKTRGVVYHHRCRSCGGRMMHFMRYCPWCRQKVKKPPVVKPFSESCPHCRWPVDTTFWNYCPWCQTSLFP